ncbi:MAG: hypothetical protein AAF391_02810 [Bacteroidota bacterium]
MQYHKEEPGGCLAFLVLNTKDRNGIFGLAHKTLADLDWKKLQSDIMDFSSKHQIMLEESDMSYGSGTITSYRLNEDFKLFYELKHSKPIAEYGSILRVYSNSTDSLSIKVKVRFIGNPSIKSSLELSTDHQKILRELGKRIGSYKWTTEHHHSGWPFELKNTRVMKFECKQINLAAEELDSIRKIHLNLSKISA